jgi:hypothetical protein
MIEMGGTEKMDAEVALQELSAINERLHSAATAKA